MRRSRQGRCRSARICGVACDDRWTQSPWTLAGKLRSSGVPPGSLGSALRRVRHGRTGGVDLSQRSADPAVRGVDVTDVRPRVLGWLASATPVQFARRYSLDGPRRVSAMVEGDAGDEAKYDVTWSTTTSASLAPTFRPSPRSHPGRHRAAAQLAGRGIQSRRLRASHERERALARGRAGSSSVR